MSKIDRRKTRLFRSHAAAERVSQVWELTREAWALRNEDPEQPLQRDVAVLIRRASSTKLGET